MEQPYPGLMDLMELSRRGELEDWKMEDVKIRLDHGLGQGLRNQSLMGVISLEFNTANSSAQVS